MCETTFQSRNYYKSLMTAGSRSAVKVATVLVVPTTLMVASMTYLISFGAVSDTGAAIVLIVAMLMTLVIMLNFAITFILGSFRILHKTPLFHQRIRVIGIMCSIGIITCQLIYSHIKYGSFGRADARLSAFFALIIFLAGFSAYEIGRLQNEKD